jgi:hypothetical protein
MEDSQNSNYTVRILEQSEWEKFKDYRTRNLSQTFVTAGSIPEIPRKLEGEDVPFRYLGAFCERGELAGHAVLDLEDHLVSVEVDYQHRTEEVEERLYLESIQYFKERTAATQIRTLIKEGGRELPLGVASHFREATHCDDITGVRLFKCNLSRVPQVKPTDKTYG